MIIVLFLLLLWGVPVFGQEPSASFIGGYDSDPTDRPSSSVDSGLLLVGELGCTSCHTASVESHQWLQPRQAPRLDSVAQRIDPFHLADFINDPASTHAGTVMPEMLSHLTELDRQVAVRRLVAYLVDRSKTSWQSAVPDRVAIDEGKRLYHQVGCVSCHEPLGLDATNPADSNLLTGRVEHWSQPQLARFLRDPHSSRPSGRMPSLGLSHREADAIAHFLLRETKIAAPLDLAVDRGHRKGLADSTRSRPWKTSIAEEFTLPENQRGNDVTTHFSGWLRIKQAGEYHFYLKVDDIGRLRIGEKNVIDLGGTRNYQRKKVVERDASIELEAGLHRIEVSHFQWIEDAILELEWQGPGFDRGPIDSSLLTNFREPLPAQKSWELIDGDAEIGEQLYKKFGCANCHEETIAAKAPPLEELTAVTSDRPHAKYTLSQHQTRDIEAALQFLKSEPSRPSPEQRVDLTLKTFRCTACHTRGDLGGVPTDRRDFFTGTDPLLGDEGRMPPPLAGVGDKLQPNWLDTVIRRGRSVRDYMNTRMPHFNHPQTLKLASDLIAVDRQATSVPRLIHDAETAKSAGQKMASVNTLQCVLCHDFNRKQSVGMRALDLVTTTERLNRDWFHRYMLDPESLRPGTQMLAFWSGGRSLLPDLLDGDSGQQVQALWAYLKDGEQAVFPAGLSRQQKELIVGGEAIIYRGKLWQAGYRGIAVGLPEGLHYAFDAQELRLALLWKDRFLDAGAHWSSQGMGRIRPSGREVVTFSRGPDVAFLPDVNSPWPGDRKEGIRPADYRFLGYKIGPRNIPTLKYQAGSLDIEETLIANKTKEDSWLERTIQFTSNNTLAVDGLFYLRLREIPTEQILDDGSYIYPDGLQIQISDESLPHNPAPLIAAKKNQETWIVLPVSPNETRSISIQYRWGDQN
ncbi:MAG: c-type cytochrome [Planctomycetota bacterium]